MDLLFSRYASPFFIITGYIHTGRFFEFITEFINLVNEEKDDVAMWEFFLHRVWDKSYDDFVSENKKQRKVQQADKTMSKKAIADTINNSLQILQNFKPNQSGGGEGI